MHVDTADEALVKRCQAGERAAWRSLHGLHYPRVAAVLRKLGVQAEDLEDSVQEVFLQVFRSLAGFRGDAALTTWLYRLCISQARRSRLQRKLGLGLLRRLMEAPPAPAPAGLGLTDAATLRLVQAALGAMKEHDRAAFVLYEMEGLGVGQVATILECPESTVYRRVHHARHVLQKTVSQVPMGALRIELESFDSESQGAGL